MPYRKYNRRYKKRKGNIFWRRGRNKALYMAKKALSMLNVEKKNHDLTVTNGTVPDAAGNIQQLTNINIGDTTNTRDGSQIRIVSFFIRGTVRMSASATRSTVRLMLVLDKQTNLAIYALTDLLADGSATDSVNSVNNLNNKHRFTVLWDKIIPLSIDGAQIRSFKYFKKLSIKMRYNGTGGGMGDITSYSLSLVRISDEATNVPTISHVIRLRYIDN